MAWSLLRSDAVGSVVCGFDLNPEIVSKFYTEAKEAGKTTTCYATPEKMTLHRLDDWDTTTNVVLIVLVNEAQCQSVCFEGNCDGDDDGVNLESLLQAGRFLDCPVSGGPVRALARELTIMASGEPE